MCDIMYGDKERKLGDMLLANVLCMKNIVMANRCIYMWYLKKRRL